MGLAAIIGLAQGSWLLLSGQKVLGSLKTVSSTKASSPEEMGASQAQGRGTSFVLWQLCAQH